MTKTFGDTSIEQMDRRREDGFAWDAIVTRISFIGPDRPETGDRLITRYLR